MKSISSEEMKSLDRRAIEEFNVTGLTLMENAGRGITDVLTKYYKPKAVLILCGKGNNGGDGFVVARLLADKGIAVNLIAFGGVEQYSGDALTNLKRLKETTAQVYFYGDEPERFDLELEKSELVLDALLGIGIDREVKSPYKEVIKAVNQAGKIVISVDIPSGLHADTGEVLGAAVQANRTVTMAVAKKGLFKGEGPANSGEIDVVDIGIPPELVAELDSDPGF